jgi:hypothetical protein
MVATAAGVIAVPFVSPLRAGGAAVTAVAEPDDEPPLPQEAEARAAADAAAPTAPIEAGPGQVLNIRFGSGAGRDQVVQAMQAFKQVISERPGETRVVLHLPGALPLGLRPVAYDAELLAEIQRRIGNDLVDLSLA